MSNSAIIAKSRAVYGTFLKKDDYDNLIHRTSVSAIASYLKGAPRYKKLLEGADPALTHRGQIEALIGKEIFETYMRVRRYSTAKRGGITDFYTRSIEAEQLSHAIVAVATGNQQSFFLAIPDYIMDKLSFSAEAAAKSENFSDLLHVIDGTIYFKALKPYLEAAEPDINKCLNVINACYIKWAFTSIDNEFKGKKRGEIKRFFLKKADCDNVLRCYRLKKFFDEGDDRIKSLLVPYHSRVKPEDIDDALKSQDPTSALIQLLSEKCIPSVGQVNDDYPEIDIAREIYRCFKQRLALTTDETEAVYALIMLMETERENLLKIIEGIRYGMQPQEIEAFIIT